MSISIWYWFILIHYMSETLQVSWRYTWNYFSLIIFHDHHHLICSELCHIAGKTLHCYLLMTTTCSHHDWVMWYSYCSSPLISYHTVITTTPICIRTCDISVDPPYWCPPMIHSTSLLRSRSCDMPHWHPRLVITTSLISTGAHMTTIVKYY
jgi:hypothetical protein